MRTWLLAVVSAAALALPIQSAAQEAASRDRPGTSLRPRIGSPGVDGAIGTFGVSVVARLSPRFGLVIGGQSWSFETGCALIYPSTCGDDGASLTGGVRVALLPTRKWTPFVEGQVGRYWFSADARDGHATSSLGFRGGVDWVFRSKFEIELAIEFQRLSGYAKGSLDFPVIEIKDLQLAVGIPIL